MKTKMMAKKLISVVIALLMCITLCLSFAGCNDKTVTETPKTTTSQSTADETAALTGVWADADYTEDTVIGEGATTFYFEVQAEDYSVTFTVNTDKEILGDALLEYELVAGEDSTYGLYVKTVNGILADYDVNATYWSFTKDGEMMMTGVDGETIESGAHYEMVYTKG